MNLSLYTYFKKHCRRERRMAVVERKLHDRKELWFPYLQNTQWVLRNYDGNKKPTDLHIWQWKTVFLHALHVHFSFFDILKTSSFFLWREWPFLQLCGRREHMLTNVQFCLVDPKRWFRFNSRIVKAHFSGIMTLNNWKISETRSDICRWRSRFRRRRVCLSSLISLLILPYERPTGPGLTWQTISLAIEGRHCMEPASWELISY